MEETDRKMETGEGWKLGKNSEVKRTDRKIRKPFRGGRRDDGQREPGSNEGSKSGKG